jgi:hypothetical protein
MSAEKWLNDVFESKIGILSIMEFIFRRRARGLAF